MAVKRGSEDATSWETVEHSEEAFSDTGTDSFDQSPQVLELPELTADVLADMEAQLNNDTATSESMTQVGEPGSLAECDVCGREVRVRRDGQLSKHKCEPKPQRGNRFETLPSPRPKTPKRAREFVISIAAWGVEEGSAHALARPFNVDPSDVPTQLPDAEEMLGPPLDLVWPHIPDSAQKFIAELADNSDVIACAIAWAEWVRTLSKWTRDQRAYQQRLQERSAAHGSSEFAGTPDFGTVVAFQPQQP